MSETMLPRRRLGRSALEVNTIGMGCAKLCASDGSNHAARRPDRSCLPRQEHRSEGFHRAICPLPKGRYM